MKPSVWSMLVVMVVVLVASEVAEVAVGVTCNPSDLSPCAGAVTSSSPPSKLCCTRLNEQKPCLCQYLSNPALKPYVNTPNAKKLATTCGVTLPSC